MYGELEWLRISEPAAKVMHCAVVGHTVEFGAGKCGASEEGVGQGLSKSCNVNMSGDFGKNTMNGATYESSCNPVNHHT
jgi:hypothetical protein